MKLLKKIGTATLVLLAIASAPAEPIRVLLVTGGHPYDLNEFHDLFNNVPETVVTHVELEDHSEIFENIAGWSYDTVVLYNMTHELSDHRLQNLFTLTEWGVGMVPLHHGTLSWTPQPRVKEIFGVEFPNAGPFGFHIGQQFTYNIVDANHPITEGMEDWEAIDETYTNYYGKGVPGNRVLITTDHQPADIELVWVRKVNNSRIANIQGGHDRLMFENPNYRELLKRAIHWTAGRLPEEIGGEALADTTIYRSQYEMPALIGSIPQYSGSGSRAALVGVENRLNDPETTAEDRARLLEGLASIAKDPDAMRFSRIWAMQQIGVHGSARDLAAIESLLHDELLYNEARYAFEQSTDSSADDMLLSALDTSEGDVRRGILRSLTARENTNAIDPAIEMLEEGDAKDRSAAAAALGFLGGKDARRALERAIKDAEESELFALEDALLTWAETASSRDARNVYTRLREKGSAPFIRASAWRGSLIQSSAKASDLEKALNAEEAIIRDRVLRAIPEMSLKGLHKVLAEKFSSMNQQEQLAALYAIEQRNEAEGIPLLHSALDSSDPVVGSNALYVAGSIGDASTAAKVLSMVGSLERADVEQARDALSTMRAPAVEQKLVEALDSEDKNVRLLAVRGLTARGATAQADRLFAATEDPERTVRSAAYDAVGELGGDPHIGDLISTILSLGNSPDQRNAQRALSLLLSRSDRAEENLQALSTAIESADEPAAESLVRSMASLRTDAARDRLIKLASDDRDALRLNAIRTLSEWGDASVAPALLEIAAREDRRESTLAARGFVKAIAEDPTVPSEEKLAAARRVMPLLNDKAAKTGVLSMVSPIPSFESLQIAMEMTNDPDVEREAVMAIVQLSTPLSFDHPKEVQEALRKVVDTPGLAEEARAEAKAGLEFLEVYGQRVLANWSFATGTDGWEAQNQSTIEAVDGALVVTSEGEDPFMGVPVDIPRQMVLLQFRVKYDDPGVIQFFMRTDDLNMGDPGTMFAVQPRRSTGDWLDYEVEFMLPGHLREFRMDPSIRPGVVQVDYIRLLKAQTP